MESINLTQKQFQALLEDFYKKGNEQSEIKTKEFLNEMIKYIQTTCSTNR